MACCLTKPGLCNAACEYSCPCRLVGRIGIPALDEKRKPLFLTSALLGVVGLALRAVAVTGLSKETVKGAPWVIGHARGQVEADIYINLAGLKMERHRHANASVSLGTFDVEWDDDACESSLVSGSHAEGAKDFCERCKDASLGCVTFTIMSLITTLVGINKDFTRLRREKDHNCAKTMTIVAGTIGTISQLSGILNFKAGCTDQLPRVSYATTLDFSLGAGSTCFVIACVLKVLSTVIHLLVPVPSARWKLPYNEADDPCPGVWPQVAAKEIS